MFILLREHIIVKALKVEHLKKKDSFLLHSEKESFFCSNINLCKEIKTGKLYKLCVEDFIPSTKEISIYRKVLNIIEL